jgi:hypothetical protein
MRLPLRRLGLLLGFITVSPFFLVDILEIGRIVPVYIAVYVACLVGAALIYPRLHPFGGLTPEEREDFIVPYMTVVAPWTILRRTLGGPAVVLVGVGGAIGVVRSLATYDHPMDLVGIVISACVVVSAGLALRNPT